MHQHYAIIKRAIFFIVLPFTIWAQKQEKIVNKAETKYYSGEYKSAYKYNTKLINKEATLNLDSRLKANLYLNQALAAEAVYEYDVMNQYLTSGLLELENIVSDTTYSYAKGLRKASYIYFQAGNFLKSEEYLNKALKLKLTPELKKDLEADLSKVLAAKFNLNEALQLSYANQDYWFDRINPVNTSIKNDQKTKSLSAKEIKKRKRDYADFINQRAYFLLKKGKYTSLDSAINANEAWMKKNIQTRNIQYRDHFYIRAQREEARNNLKGACSFYEKANKYTKFNKIEKKGVEVQDKLAYLYFLRGKKRESIKSRIKLERAAEEYFGINSIHFAKFKFQEVRELYAVGKYDKADKKLAALYKLKVKYPIDHTFSLAVSDMKMKLAIKNSNFDQALDTLNKTLTVKAKLYGDASPLYNIEKLKLADFYANYTSNFKAAKEIQEYSFEKVVAPQLSVQNLDYVRYLQEQANTYDLIEKYDLAIKYLEDAGNNIKQFYGKENIEYASDLEKLASVLIKKGDYTKAEELIGQALAILQKTSSKTNAAEKSSIYLTLAKLYSTLGLYEEAENALAKASKYSRKTSKTEKLASVKSSDEIASLYIKEGRFNEADELLTNTLIIKEKRLGLTNRELIPTLNLLGDLNIIVGNYSAAEKNIRKSLSLTSKNFTENSVRYAEALRLLEKLYRELGDFEKAEQTDKQILDIQKAQLGSNHIDIASTLTRLALIKLYGGGDVVEAEKMFNDALAIVKFNLGDKNPLYAEQLKYLAYLFAETKRYDEAEKSLDEAEKIWATKLGKKNVYAAEIAMLKGNIYSLQGKYSSAQIKYYEARQLYADIFSEKHPSYVKATSKLARTYYINKEYARSLKLFDEAVVNYLDFTKKYFPSLSFSEKAKYWNQIKEDFEFYNSLAFKLKDKNPVVMGNLYNNMLATKAILLSSSIKVKQRILNSKDENLINKYNEWTAKKQNLILVLSMPKETQIQSGIDPSQIEKEILILEKELSESSELFAASFDNKAILWNDIKKTLKPNEYAVEILRFRAFDHKFSDSIVYAALIVSNKSDKAPQVVVLPKGHELETRNLKYYKNSVIIKAEEDNISYEAYWKPIKNLIPDNATVYISSEGVYNEINLESIMISENVYAIDKNLIVPVSNTKDLVTNKLAAATAKSKPKISKAVLFGNPTFYASAAKNLVAANDESLDRSVAKPAYASTAFIKQLPGTEIEINEIDKLFINQNWNVKKYSQQTADEDSIKSIRNPRILHIATHGYFNPDQQTTSTEQLSSIEVEFSQNPLLRSGLLLRGAGDVLKNNNSLKINSDNGVLTAYEAMDLNLDNTDLVVLSACETGKGDVQIGEGVFGLQRSILIAGAKTLVMTLFKVDDEITKELMIQFYKEWLQTGDLRKSFTNSKKMIKNKYKYPVYWGSFVMIGID